jgi:hypothetical protein
MLVSLYVASRPLNLSQSSDDEDRDAHQENQDDVIRPLAGGWARDLSQCESFPPLRAGRSGTVTSKISVSELLRRRGERRGREQFTAHDEGRSSSTNKRPLGFSVRQTSYRRSSWANVAGRCWSGMARGRPLHRGALIVVRKTCSSIVFDIMV